MSVNDCFRLGAVGRVGRRDGGGRRNVTLADVRGRQTGPGRKPGRASTGHGDPKDA